MATIHTSLSRWFPLVPRQALRGIGHGTKTTFGAVSGIVGLQIAQQELAKQMQAGQLTQQQVRCAVGGRELHTRQTMAQRLVMPLWEILMSRQSPIR